MKAIDIVVCQHAVQSDVTVRGRLIQNDAVINSRLTKCDVTVPKVLTQSAQDYISVFGGIAFLVRPVSMAATKAASSSGIGRVALAADITEYAEKYASISRAPLAIHASAALSSSFSPDIQGSGIAIGCLCDAVLRRLRKLSEVDAMGTLGSIDEMTLSEIDYVEQ